jgi:hydrogenase expression/formation protein HypC
MCLAIPSKIVEIDENNFGIIDVAGSRKRVSLMMLEEPQIGDYVIVHSGFAMRKVDEAAAKESLKILKAAFLGENSLDD